jgi:D-3-phosphoglycerate dehydrogenase
MKPFLGLIGRMGEFVAQIAPPNPDKVVFIYNGKLARYDCAPLTVCGLAALLDRQTEQEVNMVNARLVAKGMGIAVEEVRTTESESFSNLITLVIESPEGKRIIAATLFEGIPKIVKMRDFLTDFTPEEHMLVLTYADKPGLIGKIGTILGEAGINIGSMNLGRQAKAGEAMVVLSLDTPADEATLQKLAAAVEAHFIKAVHMR